MEHLDLTEGLCGWDSTEKENDKDISTLSHEMELRNMFNKLKIINKEKIQNKRTQRPKSSSLINTRRRLHEQNIAKTARTLPKQNGNKTNLTATSKNKSSECVKSSHSKTSKKALIKAYLPQSYNRKKLQRSHSNLYIRDTNKRQTNNNIPQLSKKQKAINLDLDLNLDAITDIAEPVPFSEALFRSKYPETKSKSAQSKRKHRMELSKDALSPNPNDTYKQLKNKPFLTPSTSLLSLHEKPHKKMATKSRRNKAMFKRPKTTRKLYSQTSAIPVKCFNSNVLNTHQPKINTHRNSRVWLDINYRAPGGGQRDKSHIRSQSVDLSDSKENDGLSASEVARFRRAMMRDKENINIVRDSKLSLEQNLKHVISRWESHEKMKSRKSCRQRRIPLFNKQNSM